VPHHIYLSSRKATQRLFIDKSMFGGHTREYAFRALLRIAGLEGVLQGDGGEISSVHLLRLGGPDPPARVSGGSGPGSDGSALRALFGSVDDTLAGRRRGRRHRNTLGLRLLRPRDRNGQHSVLECGGYLVHLNLGREYELPVG
jgi:hypothetical protein